MGHMTDDIVYGIVKGNRMHVGRICFENFDILDRSCGFCPNTATPNESGIIGMYNTDDYHRLKFVLDMSRDRHGVFCECVACLEYATGKNLNEEDD